MKDLKFNILLNDQYTSKMKSIASTSSKSFAQIRTSIKKTGQLTSNLESLNQKLNFLEKKRKLSFDTKEIKQVSKEIRKVSKEIEFVEKKGGIRQKTGSMLGKAGAMIGGAGLLYGGIRLGSEIVQTTAKYERFGAVLKNSFSSGYKGQIAMSNLTKFAANTPFQIDELTDSFIKLRSQGFTPSMAEMTKLGDVASSKGKSFGQLSEALLDAQMGEFERLKEFGIKGSTTKTSYKFTYNGETKEIQKSADAVKDYVLSLGEMKGIQGSMAAISLTTGGAISNLGDSWDQLQNTIGSANSGSVKGAISGLTSIVAKVNDWYSVPLSRKLREEKANVNALVSEISNYNVGSDERNRLISILQQQYPEFLGNLDSETATNDKLLLRLNAVNAAYDKKIKLQASSEIKDQNASKLEEARQTKDRANLQLQLMQMAEKGDKGALEALQDNLTFWEERKAFGKKILNIATAGILYSSDSWKSLKSKYNEEIASADRVILSRGTADIRYSATQKNAEIQAYLDDKSSMLETLSPTKRAKYDLLSSNLKETGEYIEKFGLKRGTRGGGTIDYGSEAERLISEIDNLFGQKRGGVSPGLGGSLGSGVNKIDGDSRIAKNLTINISELGNDMQIVSSSTKEGSAEIKKHILDALLAAVNDVNTM